MMMMKKKPKIKTFLGELEVEAVYTDSHNYWAVTGKGLSRRSWMITKAEYDRLKRELEQGTVNEDI